MTVSVNRRFTQSKLFLSVAATAAILAGSNSYAEGLVLEEVVVTAQKRAENMQDVAASIAAVTGEDLESNGINNFADVAKMIPGLTMKQGAATDASIAMRGISYDRQSATAEAVDVYWNGAVSSPSAMFTSMFDVERIEVLRGPQGTLQGKTSPAGAILMHTKTPSFDVIEGQIKSTIADDGTQIGEFGISLPINDTLAVRLAGIYNSNEGNGNKNLTTGFDDDTNVQAGRITIAFQLEDFDATLTSEYVEHDASEVFQMAGEGSPVLNPTSGALSLSDRSGLMARGNRAQIENEITVLEMNWHNLGGHTLTSNTSFSSTNILNQNDRDLANYTASDFNQLILGFAAPSLVGEDVYAVNDTLGSTSSFSQELRIDRNDDSWWQYTAGVYYANTKNNVTNLADLQPSSGAVQLDFDIALHTEEIGFFTHNRIEISETQELQVGLRFTRSKRNNSAQMLAGKGYTTGTALISAGDAAYFSCLYTADACGASLTGTQLTSVFDIEDQINEAYTGTVKYLHYFTEDVMGYSSFDVSYRPSGVGIEPRIIRNADKIQFSEENTKAIELGVKSTLLDGRMQLNLAYYYQEMDGFQNRFKEIVLNDDDLAAGNPFVTGVTNNADAISQGLELEMVGLISEDWKASMALSYSDFNFADGATGPCNEGGTPTQDELFKTCDLSGQRVSDQGNWGLTASSDYTIALDAVDVFVRGIYTFNGSTQNPNIAGLDGRTGSYSVVDLHTGVRSKDQQWEVSLWAKNLLNKVAESEKFSAEELTVAGTDFDTGYRQVEVIKERSIGASLRYNFTM